MYDYIFDFKATHLVADEKSVQKPAKNMLNDPMQIVISTLRPKSCQFRNNFTKPTLSNKSYNFDVEKA